MIKEFIKHFNLEIAGKFSGIVTVICDNKFDYDIKLKGVLVKYEDVVFLITYSYKLKVIITYELYKDIAIWTGNYFINEETNRFELE